MKKVVLVLGLFFGLMLTMVSCSTDEYDVQIEEANEKVEMFAKPGDTTPPANPVPGTNNGIVGDGNGNNTVDTGVKEEEDDTDPIVKPKRD